MTRRLQDLPAAGEKTSVKTRWCRLQNAVHSTALAVLSHARRQHQDWFDQSDAAISNLLAVKNGLHSAYLVLSTDAQKGTFYQCRRLVQQRFREVQDSWVARKAEEIQTYADRHDSKDFFAAIKAIYGLRPKELHCFSAPMDQRL
nr:unnamed protein product [Spirometra erinaceieuropaei]